MSVLFFVLLFLFFEMFCIIFIFMIFFLLFLVYFFFFWDCIGLILFVEDFNVDWFFCWRNVLFGVGIEVVVDDEGIKGVEGEGVD